MWASFEFHGAADESFLPAAMFLVGLQVTVSGYFWISGARALSNAAILPSFASQDQSFTLGFRIPEACQRLQFALASPENTSKQLAASDFVSAFQCLLTLSYVFGSLSCWIAHPFSPQAVDYAEVAHTLGAGVSAVGELPRLSVLQVMTRRLQGVVGFQIAFFLSSLLELKNS